MNGTRFTSIPDALRDRIAARVARDSGESDAQDCIPWIGRMDRYGYGKIVVTQEGRVWNTTSHRVAWVLANGDILDPSLVIDHLCRNRACVNPDHMELVSNLENMRRGAALVSNRARLGLPIRSSYRTEFDGSDGRDGRKTCKHGHDWTAGNIYERVDSRGYLQRTCKKCSQARTRTRRRSQQS